MSESHHYDLVIIGGGINGAGIACDAAGRGLSVLLCEQNDLASGTSSWSSKLIHGGLRYLEHNEFKLVREALQEREVLMSKAPFLIQPLQFILPQEPHHRPAWMIRLGLFLYDHLAKRRCIPRSQALSLSAKDPLNPLQRRLKKGFSYYDCFTDDARLVILNALHAQQLGAQISTHTQLEHAERHASHWRIKLKNTRNQKSHRVTAQALVIATGPWISDTLSQLVDTPLENETVLVQGSHIVVPRIHSGDHAYILQHSDQRIIFVIPFHQHYSLIGTTDTPFTGDPADAHISTEEKLYLLDVFNQYFQHQLSERDIMWSFSGVRSLYNDGANDPASITREYKLELDAPKQKAPLLAIFGGKITTYRTLAEAAMLALKPYFHSLGPTWTANSPLPGGDLKGHTAESYTQHLITTYPGIPQHVISRFVEQYGTRTEELLAGCSDWDDLGMDFGAGLTQREIDFLRSTEWAETAEDILWRRTKLGLSLTPEQQQRIIDALP